MQEIIVQPYDWVEDNQKDGTGIRCWALDQNSFPNLIRIPKFPLFYHIELPTIIRGRYYLWKQAAVAELMNYISNRLGEAKPMNFSLKYRKRLYYYSGSKRYPMITLSFSCKEHIWRSIKLFDNVLKTQFWGDLQIKVWENDVPSIRKLFSLQEIAATQWIRISAYLVEEDEKIATIEKEYIVNWSDIIGVSFEESKEWHTYPLILSFDIEAFSDTRAMTDKYNANHKITMISATLKRYNKGDIIQRYGIIAGECGDLPPDVIKNTKVIQVCDEIDIIYAFETVIRNTDPDIVTGYNINQYDYPYLDHRLIRKLKSWGCNGRLINVPSIMKEEERKTAQAGYLDIHILQMEGRLSIDVLPVIKKDYLLDTYRLEYVCKKFIGRTKLDMTAQEMFDIYKETTSATKNLVLFLNTTSENAPEYHEQKEILKQKLTYWKNETAKVLEYCVRDSDLVIELMEKLSIWQSLTEMSSVVGITIKDLLIKGQQVKCLSLLYEFASKDGFVLSSRDTNVTTYCGGYVAKPIPGLYDNIICLDFASLYPSIMEAYNMCYTTLVPNTDDVTPDSDCHIIEFTQEEDVVKTPSDIIPIREDIDSDEEDEIEDAPKTKKASTEKVLVHYRYRFYKHKQGLLPKMVSTLVARRRQVIKECENLKAKCKELDEKEKYVAIIENFLNDKLTVMSKKEAAKELEILEDISKTPTVLEIATTKKNFFVACLMDLEGKKEDTLEYKIALAYKTKNKPVFENILQELKNGSEVRVKEIKKLKTNIVVLDKRQLALKVSSNSIYGFLAIQTGAKLPLVEAAMCITAKGRELINDVANYIDKTYQGKLIYTDTDSVMVSLPQVKSAKDCYYWGRRLSEEISGIPVGGTDCDGNLFVDGKRGLYPPPLRMAFEKAMRMLAICKKRYCAYFIGKDGKFKLEDVLNNNGDVVGIQRFILTKGIILAGKGNAKMLKDLYSKILNLVMDRACITKAIDLLVESINELIKGKIDYKELVMIRKLGADYKSPNYPMNLFAEYLRLEGKIVNPGDRLEFLYIRDPNEPYVGNRMRLQEQYEEKQKTPYPEELDYMYYISNVFAKPINQLFSVGFSDIINSKLKDCIYEGISLAAPLNIIQKMISNGIDIQCLSQAVKYNMEL